MALQPSHAVGTRDFARFVPGVTLAVGYALLLVLYSPFVLYS